MCRHLQKCTYFFRILSRFDIQSIIQESPRPAGQRHHHVPGRAPVGAVGLLPPEGLLGQGGGRQPALAHGS